MTIEEIQEECKRKFPIGCVYSGYGVSKQILLKDEFTYKIVNNHIYTHFNGGVLYNGNTGKFAELISLPDGYKPIEELKSNQDYTYLITLFKQLET